MFVDFKDEINLYIFLYNFYYGVINDKLRLISYICILNLLCIKKIERKYIVFKVK